MTIEEIIRKADELNAEFTLRKTGIGIAKRYWLCSIKLNADGTKLEGDTGFHLTAQDAIDDAWGKIDRVLSADRKVLGIFARAIEARPLREVLDDDMLREVLDDDIPF